MAKRPGTPAELRDAVERTVQATIGSAERQRERTQGAIDDLTGTVDQLRRGAEAGVGRARRALEDRRPATSEDIRELKAELRRLGRRLDAIEERLPAKRSSGAKSPSSAKRSSGAKSPSSAKRSSGAKSRPSAKRSSGAKSPSSAKRSSGASRK
jgi:chromosome segregation ATPase